MERTWSVLLFLLLILACSAALGAKPTKDDASIHDEMETDISHEDNTDKNDSKSKKSGNNFVSKEGMTFASLEEFESLYYSFAVSEGYTVRIRRTTKFAHTDRIRYCQYVCSCAGFCEEKKTNDGFDVDQEKISRRTLTRRTGCLVNISISYKNGVWKVGKINKEHNHLLVSPNSRIHLKHPGGMPSVAKSLVEKFSEVDLPIGRVADVVNCDANINVSQRDCWNHKRDLRRKNLDSGDANAVLQYCIAKKSQDPNFIFDIPTDDEDRLVNFFWIDSTARQYYERFGDVLVFDTTYKTNKYGLPLGNFVGVNNHTQSIMFGFALLQNEQEETFVWLFETWLHAVGGKLPVSILTDQDRAIENAIRKVFPTVSHRFCLWHITNKFPEKFGSLYKENSPFGRDMKKCLYNSVTTEQFDNAWNEIMEDYKLTENEWLNNLFEIRQSWVPVYNRIIFYAGMNTTQRCESIHSFFDSFLNKGTTLREFVVKYEHALEHRYRAEHVERFASIYQAPILQLKSPLEKQAAEVYTRNIFNLFQVELIESLKLQNDKLEKNGSSRMYKVSSFLNTSDEFVVIFDVETREVSCECHLFEFKGILCRHALTIFNKKKVANVPSKYILPRWTKKAGEGISIPLFKKDEDKSSMVSDLKFSNMMSRLRAYLHVSTNSCDIIMEGLDGLLERVSNLKLEENHEGNKSATIEVGCVENSVELPSISNPLIAKTKGRTKENVGVSKNGRFKRGFEVRMENSKKSKRQCKSCGQYGHYSSTCDRKKRADVMEEAHTES